MLAITKTLKEKYYTYHPGEFLPVYVDGELVNKKSFHAYKLRWIIRNREVALYQLTHFTG